METTKHEFCHDQNQRLNLNTKTNTLFFVIKTKILVSRTTSIHHWIMSYERTRQTDGLRRSNVIGDRCGTVTVTNWTIGHVYCICTLSHKGRMGGGFAPALAAPFWN